MSGPFIDQVDQDQGGKILRIFRSIFVREEFDGAGTDNDVEQYIPRLLSGLNFPSIKQQTCKKLQSLDGATIFFPSCAHICSPAVGSLLCKVAAH